MKKYPSLATNSQADIEVGLIGCGIQESRSPLMHMKEASAQGFTLHYQLFDLDLMDGKRCGHNTDWQGFYTCFHKTFPDATRDTVLQLGAGGAGSAVAYGLARSGVNTIYIYDLDVDKAKSLTARLSEIFDEITFIVPDDVESIIEISDGIINTTPVGMKKYPGTPFPADKLSASQWFVDVIYFPLETELLKSARNTGCQTMDGSGMAIHQAAEAFRLFTARQASADRMAQTFFNEF
ncbi:MAG: hypothetical protein HKN08_04635 [Gammaproteobacteria bacterium]|nr:hypothetical protein [Gammaproteobacteria bacterium]